MGVEVCTGADTAAIAVAGVGYSRPAIARFGAFLSAASEWLPIWIKAQYDVSALLSADPDT